MGVSEIVGWPALAGSISAITVYLAGRALIQGRRVRNRRTALKQQLLK